jgi:phosphoglycerate dehydrogenase-like enzyme
MNQPHIKVTSPTFSKNAVLQGELSKRPYRVTLNTEGKRLEGAALAEYLADADAAIVGLERIDEALLARCPRLRAVTKFGVGLDNVDLEVCRQRGIYIGWTPGINRRTVAEVTLGFMIGMAHNMFFTTHLLKQGTWHKEGGTEVTRKTVGIIGLGNIGKELVELLRPLGCTILGNDILDLKEYARTAGVRLTSKEEIYRTADFITLHVPLTELTHHLINEQTLALFRPEACLINTSRGKVVEQAALKKALQAKRLRAAALDVYELEPPPDLEFLQLPNLVCTPHIAGTPIEAVWALGRSAIEHLDKFFGRSQPDPARAG